MIRRPESLAASGLPPMAYIRRPWVVNDSASWATSVTTSMMMTIVGTWPRAPNAAGMVPSAISPLGSTMFSVIDPP